MIPLSEKMRQSMQLEYKDNTTLGKLIMTLNDSHLKGNGIADGLTEAINTFVVNKSARPQQVTIDEIAYKMPGHSMLPLVSNQHFCFEKPGSLIAWQFNREFYCIVDHDAEVGCVGFLFYGIHHPMFIELSPDDMKSVLVLEQLFLEDMENRDHFQGDMLRTLLKRLIIKSTRTAKRQTTNYQRFTENKMDIIRKFSLLLEINYKQQHEVNFYAKALHKSSKTLTNLFHLCNYPAPSSLIQNRIILEAKRYLYYTEKSAKEIGYELGFENPAHFSRFFKLKTGCNLSKFRSRNLTDVWTMPDPESTELSLNP